MLFVRHAIPGEQVIAEITDLGPKGRFLRADAVQVVEPSDQRIQPACPWSGPVAAAAATSSMSIWGTSAS
ncbi:hypothetical protein [Ornithinimicrobium sp. INDO-MA30-4]|uniref:hypothetical protein n=1 Tax=Ornithinimicrobium sp. INDO-MA30-4 TaxID=2908651 RepID=UPI0037C60D74